jgi:hypothetical protein
MNIEIILGVAIVSGVINILLIVILLSRKASNKGYDAGYEKGRTDALKNQGWEVQISPWKENIQEGFFMKKQTINIGYQYQLFVNGIPCLQPHVQIHEKLVITKLDKESINIAIEGLTETIKSVASIHPAIKTVGDGTNFARSLLSLVPPQKK